MTNDQYFPLHKPPVTLSVSNGPNKRHRFNRVTKFSSKDQKEALYFREIIWYHTTLPGEIKVFQRKQLICREAVRSSDKAYTKTTQQYKVHLNQRPGSLISFPEVRSPPTQRGS